MSGDGAGTTRRTALVTGGGGGLGEGIARRLAADGLAVVVVDLDGGAADRVAGAITADGAAALAIEADVTDSAGVAAAVEAAIGRFGTIDVLVNNAGWDDMKPFLETDEAFWDRVIDVNFKGPLRFTKAVLPGMVERRWGRIVNIASDAGRVGSSNEAVYSGAKGAVIAFTKTIARETASRGVTANSICPGPSDTPLLHALVAEGGDRVIGAMVKAVPMRRLATPADVAAAVGFFASDAAGYITGQTLSVSGGLTMV